MAESRKIEISLDENSIKLLMNIDKIHRESLINIGISLASKTDLYKTLTGDDLSLENSASLGLNDLKPPVNTEVEQAETKPKEKSKETTTWDNF